MSDSTQDSKPQSKSDDEVVIKVKIPDIYIVAQALEFAIKKKVFDQKMIQEIYPAWSSVIRWCEELKRRSDIDNLYKDAKQEEKPEVLPVVEELPNES